MKSAQIGATEMINNAVGYYIDQDPAPMLVVQPTLDLAGVWSKDRLAPMLRDTPALRGKVRPSRSRDADNTILHKAFPGGHVSAAGANSAVSLRGRPIRVLFCDEVDGYPPSAGAEGDPISLALKRTRTFWNRKVIYTSTPTCKGLSRIEAAYDASDKRRLWVPCPHCGEPQVLRWAQVDFKAFGEDEPGYICEHCAAAWDESDRLAAIAGGHFRADRPFKGIAGFRLWEIYSPWSSMAEIVDDFKQKKDHREQLRVFVNTTLGETFEEEGEGAEPTGLFARREKYTDVPLRAVVLTCGVDVHGDRLEYEVVAWAPNLESWGIHFGVIHEDPEKPEAWQRLDRALLKRYPHESGLVMRVSAACIDAGDGKHTEAVLRFCKGKQGRRVWAIKGGSGQGRPLWPLRASRSSKRSVGRVPLFVLGVDAGKETLYSRLALEPPSPGEPAPGYCHFPLSYDEEYFAQLCAETVTTRYSHGFPTRVWVKTRPRNEALDCRVYAMAALEGLNPDLKRMAAKLARQVAARRKRLGDEPEAEPEADTAAEPQLEVEEKPPPAKEPPAVVRRRLAHRRRRPGFVGGWNS
jgi:phage terminase large subunit GpA-like protein